ncbi:hypothetical protein IMAU10576_02469 [Lactiplantibacillus plantarum]|nr:hypothetical protein [Lactiplantibacillus plantarum]
MADVKFMDLSENDNPATTDSVLIGNSTDGLKRTSVGAIGNLFSVKGLFHFETVTGQTDPTQKALGANRIVTISAPAVPGYSFAFWLNSATIDNTMPSYVDIPNVPQSHVWVEFPDSWTTPVKIMVTAVYVKSTVA